MLIRTNTIISKFSIIKFQPGPSTSRDLDTGQYSYTSGLCDLSVACPNLTSLELINAGFVQSVVHSSHKPVFSPW